MVWIVSWVRSWWELQLWTSEGVKEPPSSLYFVADLPLSLPPTIGNRGGLHTTCDDSQSRTLLFGYLIQFSPCRRGQGIGVVLHVQSKPGSRFSCWPSILFLRLSSSGPFSWELCCTWYWCEKNRWVFCLTSLLGRLGRLASGFLVDWSARWTLLSWKTGKSRWLQSWFQWPLPTTLLLSRRWGSFLPVSCWLRWSLALLWSIMLGRVYVAPVECGRTAGHRWHQWK